VKPKQPSRQGVVRTPEELFRRMFQQAADMPDAWRMTADSLLRAAGTLVPLIEADTRAALDPSQNTFDHPVAPVYMLLAGLAIENLAKAKLVAGRSSPATVGDALVPDLKSHDLVDLLHRAGLTLSADESYLAERLQAFVEWAGRYPIPVKLEGQLPRTHPLGGWGPLNHYLGTDPAAIEALAARLR
jgi:hypothetical protein